MATPADDDPLSFADLDLGEGGESEATAAPALETAPVFASPVAAPPPPAEEPPPPYESVVMENSGGGAGSVHPVR